MTLFRETAAAAVGQKSGRTGQEEKGRGGLGNGSGDGHDVGTIRRRRTGDGEGERLHELLLIGQGEIQKSHVQLATVLSGERNLEVLIVETIDVVDAAFGIENASIAEIPIGVVQDMV